MDLKQTIDLLNNDVKNLKAYDLKPDLCKIKLNQNESPFDWPDNIKEDIAEFFKKRPLNRYPEFIPCELKKTIANYISLSPDNVIVGNGSNEMLFVLLMALTNIDQSILICEPTFTVYQLLVKGTGRKLIRLRLNSDLSFNIDEIIDQSLQNPTSLLILCSPNNPTGTSLSEVQIRNILSKHKGFIILDQAYIEFGGYSAIPLLEEYSNLIITRTFSKAFGAAGLRCGYIIGNKEIIKEVNKIKLPYNINFFTEYVARKMLLNINIVDENVKRIINQREKMYTFLNSLPIDKVYPSSANFILIQVKNKDSLFSYLKKSGILLRDVSSYPMLENCLRVCIGTEEENQIFLEKIAQFYKD